jgi:hypothetical protein
MSDGVVDVRRLDFEAHQSVNWIYIYGLGQIPDEGAAAFVNEVPMVSRCIRTSPGPQR